MISATIAEHKQYIADEVRLSALRDAIAEVVRPGDVVLDLACGTGVLGIMTCQAGARRVYSVDHGPVIALAREIAIANGMQDRMVFIKGGSSEAELPEAVDVIVADQIGRFGFDAGIARDYMDAQRFLKAGGRWVPQSVELFAAPVESEALRDDVEFWAQPHADIDFTAVNQVARNVAYPIRLEREQLLGTASSLGTLTLRAEEPRVLKPRATFVVQRNGLLHGIGAWFEAQLSPSVRMTNSPTAARRIDRQNLVFPVHEVCPVAKGDAIQLSMVIDVVRMAVSWTVEVRPVGKGRVVRFEHSTMQGSLFWGQDLKKRNKECRPALNLRGQAERTVLRLCDEQKAIAEIEAELRQAFPNMFSSGQQATEFVSEIVDRNCE
jgi:predicted nicotinamide N-methyase